MMKSIQTFRSLFLLSVLMTIEGKVVSFTERLVLIQKGAQIYHIQKKAIPEPLRSTLHQPGATVSVSVPVTAIETVRTAKN